MKPYMYIKAPPQAPASPRLGHKFSKLMPTIMVTLGSILLANVAWPIINYQFFIAPQYQRVALISPIKDSETAFFSPLATTQQPIFADQTSQILGKEIDYTDPYTWFPTATGPSVTESKITHYTLDIPKVNIEKALIEIGSDDLANNLIHYPGTGIPGQPGSPVIFGHSVLRQFYNPSINNPKRYISIFSKIMTLEDGDEIFVDFDGIRYQYVVVDKVVVDPEDVFILQQRHDRRELKLITCVPEGTYLHRGVIIAELRDINN